MAGIKSGDISKNPADLVIFAGKDANMDTAELLGKRLKMKITQEISDMKNSALALYLDSNGLALTGGGQMLRADFRRMLHRINPSNLNGELLVKAAKIKGIVVTPTAIDATAGLGEDAFLLAAAGFSIKLYENNPVIAALLQDALCRAAKVTELTSIIERMQLFKTDCLTALPQTKTRPDVILLDPMFPVRRKSALIKKKFQLLQQLEQPCLDESALLCAAIDCRPRKLIIKRPCKGPYLADRKPDYSIKGKAIRYDCIVFA